MKKILILSIALALMASANIAQQNIPNNNNPYIQNYYGLSKPIMEKFKVLF